MSFKNSHAPHPRVATFSGNAPFPGQPKNSTDHFTNMLYDRLPEGVTVLFLNSVRIRWNLENKTGGIEFLPEFNVG
jgi:hypothetical protein